MPASQLCAAFVAFVHVILNNFSLSNTCVAHYYKWCQVVAHRVPDWHTFEIFSIFEIFEEVCDDLPPMWFSTLSVGYFSTANS